MSIGITGSSVDTKSSPSASPIIQELLLSWALVRCRILTEHENAATLLLRHFSSTFWENINTVPKHPFPNIFAFSPILYWQRSASPSYLHRPSPTFFPCSFSVPASFYLRLNRSCLPYTKIFELIILKSSSQSTYGLETRVCLRPAFHVNTRTRWDGKCLHGTDLPRNVQ